MPDAGRASNLQQVPSSSSDQAGCGEEHGALVAQAQGQQGSGLGQGHGDEGEAPRVYEVQIKMFSTVSQ